MFFSFEGENLEKISFISNRFIPKLSVLLFKSMNRLHGQYLGFLGSLELCYMDLCAAQTC